MKSVLLNIIIATFMLAITFSCKTNKNTFMHRGYHNLTARYNGYYYARESIKEGEFKIATEYKYDYDRFLPVYLVPNNESAKSTFPEFDKSIKKSSSCIQKHTIKTKKGAEIPTAGKWIDNNWNVIGISHFYKREFFSGIEAFDYVIRTYKTNDKYKALIWLAKSYNEIGSPSQAEPLIGLLKDDKKISSYAKKELPILQADYYMKRGLYKEAEASLIEAINKKPNKKIRARLLFILAQLYEEKKDNKKAIQCYQKTISIKPDYDLVFNAKIKQARLFDFKNGNVSKLKKSLQSMLKDIKNDEYKDVIYYTLGEIFEKENNETLAILNYKLSVKNSKQNPKQKALSYLKLGEISFEQTNYAASGAYYDSTMITLPKDYKDYKIISNRKKTLETLIGYIKIIEHEDSLQRIAKMSVPDRDRFLNNMIKKLEEEEERKKDELENLQNQNLNQNGEIANNGLQNLSNGVKGDWYFYNQTTLSFGINDFIKKWGNSRKLEDNWRRSQKGVTFENDANTVENDSINEKGIKISKKGNGLDKRKKQFYIANLPLTDSSIIQSNSRIIDAYYNLASTYKEDLQNNKKSIFTYEELNKRFTEHKYKSATYFQLYQIYISTKNQKQADYYKSKLLAEFPNSEYTQIITNPNYAAEKNTKKGEVELFYTTTFEDYTSNNFVSAFEKCQESELKYNNPEFSPKFAFIKAMCIGKLKGIDSLEMALKKLQAIYPKDPTAKQAQELLEVLYDLKHPIEDKGKANGSDTTLTLDLMAKHLVIITSPDDPSISNNFRSALADFNDHYYANENFVITSSLFGSGEQLSIVKSFKSSEEAMEYLDNVKNDKDVFKGKIKMELFTLMAISEENLPKVIKKKQINYYKPFFNSNYKYIK